jgi:hypothetical protein
MRLMSEVLSRSALSAAFLVGNPGERGQPEGCRISSLQFVTILDSVQISYYWDFHQLLRLASPGINQGKSFPQEVQVVEPNLLHFRSKIATAALRSFNDANYCVVDEENSIRQVRPKRYIPLKERHFDLDIPLPDAKKPKVTP